MVARSRSRPHRVQAPRLGKERLQRFFDSLEQTGNLIKAASVAGIDENALRELRDEDVEFDHRLTKSLITSLEQKSTLLAVEGILEPVIADGKVARDDEGIPIGVRRYSDSLLLALLRAQDPERFALTTKAVYLPWIKWLAWSSLVVVALWAMGDLGIRLLFFATEHPHV